MHGRSICLVSRRRRLYVAAVICVAAKQWCTNSFAVPRPTDASAPAVAGRISFTHQSSLPFRGVQAWLGAVDSNSVEGLSPIYWWTRLRVFIGLLIAYATFYICRVSLNYAGPVLVKELGVDLAQIGALQSAGQISVGVNKLFCGVLASDQDPSRLLVGGLLLTGVTNACVGLLPDLQPAAITFCLACMWMLNGIWQGLGSPACARIVDAWFLPSERGTYWALWNTSNNLGGALAPIVVSAGVAFGGWRWGFGIPGLIAIGMSVLLFFVVRSTPEAAGLKSPLSENSVASTSADGTTEKGWKLLRNGVLKQPGFGKLMLVNVMVYMIRAGLQSWGCFFMLRAGSPLQLAQALATLGLLEVGGLCGSIAGGTLSDAYLARRGLEKPVVGGRIEIALLFTVGLSVVLSIFLFTPVASSGGPVTAVSITLAGFFLYGPQALIALCGMELVPRRAVGASQGVLGLSAYFGAALAGLPFALLLDGPLGWQRWRAVMMLCVVGVALTCCTLRDARSREQCEGGNCFIKT